VNFIKQNTIAAMVGVAPSTSTMVDFKRQPWSL